MLLFIQSLQSEFLSWVLCPLESSFRSPLLLLLGLEVCSKSSLRLYYALAISHLVIQDIAHSTTAHIVVHSALFLRGSILVSGHCF